MTNWLNRGKIMLIDKIQVIWRLGEWRGIGWFWYPDYVPYRWLIRIPFVCEIKKVRR